MGILLRRQSPSVEDVVKLQYLLQILHGMKNRCTNKKSKGYHRYGGRGIVICKEWKNPRRFVRDMWKGYDIGLTIDRVDNDGNYCKANCQWLDRSNHAKKSAKDRGFTLVEDRVSVMLEGFMAI
jgi:hypothetical protein